MGRRGGSDICEEDTVRREMLTKNYNQPNGYLDIKLTSHRPISNLHDKKEGEYKNSWNRIPENL